MNRCGKCSKELFQKLPTCLSVLHSLRQWLFSGFAVSFEILTRLKINMHSSLLPSNEQWYQSFGPDNGRLFSSGENPFGFTRRNPGCEVYMLQCRYFTRYGVEIEGEFTSHCVSRANWDSLRSWENAFEITTCCGIARFLSNSPESAEP